MSRVVQTSVGLFLGLFGVVLAFGTLGVMFVSRAITMWGGILALAGVIVAFLGGVIVPNSGVEEGTHKLTILINPFLDLLPGGRRRSDPPCPPDEAKP